MSAIYDKALKRKDFSGVVQGDAKNNDSEPKAGADLGKIVNLMSVDVSQVSTGRLVIFSSFRTIL